MNTRIRVCVCFAPLLLLVAGALRVTAEGPAAAAAPAAPVRVLIVTGEDVPAHDWQATTAVTRQILETGERFEVRVSEDIGILESDALHHYDVLVLNFRNNPGKRDINANGRQNLLDYVASGKGLVAVHFAVCAFGNWEPFRDLLGRYWKPKHSGHGPRGPFRVEVADADHPVTAGLEGFEIDDELYARLVEARPIHVLLEARSDWSGATEPLAWTLSYGKGRVFNLVLGHDERSRRHAAFGEVLRRGTEWAARGGGGEPDPASE
jgi:type 1 glutamine amidotransferase